MENRLGLARQLAFASGYLAIFFAPGLLVWSAMEDKAYLVCGTVLLVFPLLRVVFGPVDESGPKPLDERLALALDRLPVVYAFALATSVFSLAWRLHETAPDAAAMIGWTLSLWAVLAFANCAAHDLLHRRSKPDRLVGHLVAGLAGYPVLGYEHARHHRRPGNTDAAEWARLDESAAMFVVRRLRAILRETFGRCGLALSGPAGSPTVRTLRISTETTCAALLAFCLSSGWRGAFVYAGSALLVTVSVQLITYMQHWGLGDDSVEDAVLGDYGWDNDCQFQAWITLGLSLHHAHHQEGSQPYYQLSLRSDSPRSPAGYLLLLITALIPPLWRRVMHPALAYWREQKGIPLSAGRRLVCVAFYK